MSKFQAAMITASVQGYEDQNDTDAVTVILKIVSAGSYIDLGREI